MNQFQKDLHNENILGQFLDEHYKKSGISVERVADKGLQLQGIDFTFTDENGRKHKIDEKAQLHYLNNSLPTFALEIDYKMGNSIKPGWLFDPLKVTDIYAFIFSIHLTAGLSKISRSEDIQSCEIIFVNRNKLRNHLAGLQLSAEFCKAQSNILRADKSITKLLHSSGFNFQISRNYPEEPVNLVVRKTFLASIGKQYNFAKKPS